MRLHCNGMQGRKKTQTIQVRVDAALKERIRAVKEITRLPETVVVIACLEAYCDYVERTGEFAVPLALLPRSALPAGAGTYGQSGSADTSALHILPADQTSPGHEDYLRALAAAKAAGKDQAG